MMEGYARFGTLFATFPELTSFRKFAQLNLELLLYKEAELNWLETELESLRRKECDDPGTSGPWRDMIEAHPDSFAGQKHAKVLEIDGKMRTYRKDMLQIRQLMSLQQPTKASRRFIDQWLGGTSGHPVFLKGAALKRWWPENEPDLVSLVEGHDKLDQACAAVLAPACHAIAKHWKRPVRDEEKVLGKVWYYPPKHFTLVADMLCVLASAAVPSASIVALLFAQTTLVRLIMIAAFTLAFAAIVTLCFGCRRAETLGATVAFGAVQVVFVESVNNLGQYGS